MRNLIISVLFLALIGCSTGPKKGPDKPDKEVIAGDSARVSTMSIEGKDSATDYVTVSLAAKVKAINPKTRMITLKSAEGNEVTFKVSDAVTRLKEIKPGDSVVVEYLQSIAFEIREPTAEEKASPKTVTEMVGKAGPEAPPAAGMVRQVQTVVKVVGLDRSAKTVTIRSPEGKVTTVKARYPERLEKIKVGDTLAVTFTEAVAVSIEPIQKS